MTNEKHSPTHYKWGIFYYNKNDKRIFPPKRNPNMGWTVNFANPYSILVALALIGGVYLFATWLGKL
ncbi:MAG: DUF5808 domain-containing protein [Bacteroidota bacterium]